MSDNPFRKFLCPQCLGFGGQLCQEPLCRDPQWRQCTKPFPCNVICKMCKGEGEIEGDRISMREIQTSLPWSIRYSQDFRTNPQPHKDFAHALVHISKAAGKLAALVDDMDHDWSVADDPQLRETYGKYVADLVICAMRMSNTFPGGVLDLEKAVLDRIKAKNPQALPPPALNDGPVRWELLPECPHCKAAAKQPCLPLGNICVERILPFVKDEATKIEGT